MSFKDFIKRYTKITLKLSAKPVYLIYNIYNFFLCNYLTRIKKYKSLKLGGEIKNGIFQIFINNNQIIKIPKRNNVHSLLFFLKMMRKKNFLDYRNVLFSLKNIPHLGGYIAEPIKIKRNGGYSSTYIGGYNLREIKDKITYENFSIEKDLSLKIINQLRKITHSLKEYHKEFGGIFGDWPIHNLMYDQKHDMIVNIDLEGFYTFKKDSLENNIDYIEKELEELIHLLSPKERLKQINLNKVLDFIEYTSTRKKAYNGEGFKSAYHSIKLDGKFFRGQRECNLRLQQIDYNFDGKCVLDIGCNIGGMLHTLSNQIKLGVGIDYSPRCINAASLIKCINQENNLHFYNFNLEKEDLKKIKDFILCEKIDICFLLSICMWIKNWREVITFCSEIAKDLLFESNGSKKQQEEQINFLKKTYSKVTLLDSSSKDDPLQKNRKLYLCEN